MRLGAHVSIGGGLPRAIERALAIGAECMQVFASTPRGWKPAAHSDDDVRLFRERQAEAGIAPLFLHTIYLINLASGQADLYEKSVQSLKSYLYWADTLGAAGVITHLGSSGDEGLAVAEERICAALERVLGNSYRSPVLLETSAGMGDSVGYQFEQIARIIAGLGYHPRLQVCLDTAHVYEAGYDVASKEGLDRALAQFDRVIGLNRLKVIHANDSKTALASGVDRHENIGSGHIGREGFRHILHHPLLQHLPFIIEVPGFGQSGPDKENLDILKEIAWSP